MLRAPILTKAGLQRLHLSQIPTLLKKTLQNKTGTVSRQSNKAVSSTASCAQPLFNNQYDEYRKIEESSFTDDERVTVFTGFHDEALSILNSLVNTNERCKLPEVWYLYDEKGSKLFEDITKQPEYYLTNTELSILSENAQDIARYPDEGPLDTRQFHSSIIELGAGSGKKMRPIFDAEEQLARANDSIITTYIAVDYSKGALEENAAVYNRFDQSRASFMHMSTFVGLDNDAVRVLSDREGRKTFVYLGSSLGNDEDPVPFLQHVISHCGPQDRVLIGVDLAAEKDDKPVEIIEAAYNDKAGITSDFILNALSVVNRVAGLNFDESNFKHVAEYNHALDAVEIFAECITPCKVVAENEYGQHFPVRSFSHGDRIFIEQSGKFSKTRLAQITEDAGMLVTRTWEDENSFYRLFECVANNAQMCTEMSNYFFNNIVGENRLSHQPIDLRNPYAFYWGHIAAFSDRIALHLAGKEDYRERFERGVDPDVSDSSIVQHSHSERIQEWPSAEALSQYSNQVEEGMINLVKDQGATREFIMSIEHSDMHFETLMYNLNGCPIDSRIRMEERTGSAFRSTDKHPFATFQNEAATATEQAAERNQHLVQIDETMVSLGCHETTRRAKGFVWDNELPAQAHEKVSSFQVAATPVTNHEFACFIEDKGYLSENLWNKRSFSWRNNENIQHPVLWDRLSKKEWGVRTPCDGVVPFGVSGEWPAVVTLYEAQAYCNWLGNGARIMSEPEYHAIFDDDNEVFNRSARLGNNNWKYRTQVSVGTMNDATKSGVYDMVGNGWEWTSTAFAGLPGFEEMPDYPGYSADFFGGSHFVMKGASPYTGRSLIRLSFRNWFQPSYAFVNAKFRITY
jgi:uncharacterized SAM-dependent methyltransferase/formylglycine-generating enzyme required for sulfatase activity